MTKLYNLWLNINTLQNFIRITDSLEFLFFIKSTPTDEDHSSIGKQKSTHIVLLLPNLYEPTSSVILNYYTASVAMKTISPKLKKKTLNESKPNTQHLIGVALTNELITHLR